MDVSENQAESCVV